MSRLEPANLRFCYPTVTLDRDALAASDAFDLALAAVITPEVTVITNDFHLDPRQRVLVLTGPNQGGKTTFARMVGQLHYLASLGVPVPGSEATLLLADKVSTLFEQGENLADLRGHLHDDLVRAHDMVQSATPRSVLIINEIFTSTSLGDATFLSREILLNIIERGSLCVFVTFIDELSTLDESTISYVAEVTADDPDRRTFKVTYRPADGLAYAKAVATRYGLGYEYLTRRLSR